MSLEAMKQVTEAEEANRARRAEAQAEAKRLVAEAERAGKARLAEARAQAEAQARELMRQAEAFVSGIPAAHADAVSSITFPFVRTPLFTVYVISIVCPYGRA